MKKAIVFATAVALSTPALASFASTGSEGGILSMSANAILFNQFGSRSAVPSCASGNPTRWAFNSSTADGQNMLSVLLSAWAAQKQIYISGTGNCSVWGDTETVQFIGIAD